MKREDTLNAIERFCVEPKTTSQIAQHLGIDQSSVYVYLSALQRYKRLAKRGDDKRRNNPAKFVTLRLEPVVPIDNANPMIAHAHNPFGI